MRTRRLALLIIVALLAVSCRVSTDGISTSTATRAGIGGAEISGSAASDGLPAVGPIPQSSHWHAAYVVRICDDVLDPFASEADPLGIHSHADGIMHVHPFFEESGYESATLGLFADAMEFEISTGELTLPGGGTWRDGDLCDGVPGRVFVDRWENSSPDSAITRIFADPQDARFLADGELYQIAFAPADSLPVVPPTQANLGEYSNLGPAPEPWVDIDPSASSDAVDVWAVQSISGEPCGDLVPERVLSGPVRCFEPAGERLSGGDAFESARAVAFNRRPSVEVRLSSDMQAFLRDRFAETEGNVVIAIEVDGYVITAPQLAMPPATDRLIISGGFSAETALALAALLTGE